MMQIWAQLKGHLLLVALLSITLRLLLMSPYGLNDDEAYYWMWAHMPSLSYYDNTPGAAWFLQPLFWINDHSLIGLRVYTGLMGVIAIAAISQVIFSLAPDLTLRQKTIALWLVAANGLILMMTLVWTPDVMLLVFSSLAFWQLVRALNFNQPWGWVWAGLFLALAFIAKANSALYTFIIGLWLLSTATGRVHLQTRWPWIGASLIVVAIIPVIVWNAQNDWVFFRYQFGHVLSPESSEENPAPFAPHYDELLTLLGSILLLCGVTAYSFIRLPRFTRGQTPAGHLFLTLVVATLLMFSAIAFYKSFFVNWALITMMLIFILGLAWVVNAKPRIMIFQALFTLPVLLLVILLNFVPQTAARAANWRDGLVWDQIYQIMRQQQSAFSQPPILAATKYQDASQLAWQEYSHWGQLPGGHAVPALNLNNRSNHYAHIWPDETYRDHNLLVIHEKKIPDITQFFCNVETLGPFKVEYENKVIRRFYLSHGTQFSGRPDIVAGKSDHPDCP